MYCICDTYISSYYICIIYYVHVSLHNIKGLGKFIIIESVQKYIILYIPIARLAKLGTNIIYILVYERIDLYEYVPWA